MQDFNYHSHTYRCGHADLDMKDEEYVKEYIKMGFKKIAITDHCPEKNLIDKRNDMRMSYESRIEYLESIKALKEKYKEKIEIMSGYEVEFLPGEEENLKELKSEVDKIILGQHFIYNDDKDLKIFNSENHFTDKELLRYAEYIEKAMEHGIPDIIAHPDLFLRGRKGFFEIEQEVTNRICRASEKYNVPLEINLNNIFGKTYYRDRKLNNLSFEEQRKQLKKVGYPNKDFWEIASNYNIKVLFGIDAHHRGQILLWKELVKLADELLGKEIMNKLNFIEE